MVAEKSAHISLLILVHTLNCLLDISNSPSYLPIKSFMFKTKLFCQMFFLLCYFSECHNHPSNCSRELTLTLFFLHHIQLRTNSYWFFFILNIFYICPHLFISAPTTLEQVLVIFHLDFDDSYSLAPLPSVSHFSNLFFTLLVPIVYKVMVP